MQIYIQNISNNDIYIDNNTIQGGFGITLDIDDQNVARIIEAMHKYISCIKIDILTIFVQSINNLYGTPRITIDLEQRLILIFTLYWIQSTINNASQVNTHNESPDILENTRNVDTK